MQPIVQPPIVQPKFVSGTWDFKWPLGTTIRVAFQELPEDDKALMPPLSDIIGRYTEIANRWLERKANIGFTFLDTYLPAPMKRGQTLSLRSPRTGDPVSYDVLVSFASSPSTIFGENLEEDTQITGQVSVVGSYARRINYGTPTTIVGPNSKFKPDDKKLGDYFADPYFDEIVLHEVGHVLGIAHQQQNPLYRNRPIVRSDERIHTALARIRKIYWTEFSPEISQEIRELWPARTEREDQTIPYSDWQVIEGGDGKRLENETVMAHPIWSDLVDGKFASLNDAHQTPTKWDFAQLEAMYPAATSQTNPNARAT